MNAHQRTPGRRVRGVIRRRLLVNALVDPDEAASQLPAGVRPHVTERGTVVGCCLLDVHRLRPDGVPAIGARTLRAAAHRISAEWEDGAGEVITGVYVPVRHTDSRLAMAAGGRWFPGVHERARVEVSASEGHLRWTSDPVDGRRLGIRVAVSIPTGAETGSTCEPVGATCLAASHRRVARPPRRPRGGADGARAP